MEPHNTEIVLIKCGLIFSAVVLALRRLRHFLSTCYLFTYVLKNKKELKRSEKLKSKERKRSGKERKGTKRSG